MTPALESLRRKAAPVVALPARRDHVAYLDGWRGVCIAFVLIGHLIPAVAPLATVGVEMFFVLSGRLMAEILIFKRQPVRIFLKRRVARIIPATATFVVVTAAIMNATWWLAGRPLNWISPLGALFFFHNYIPPAAVAPAFDQMWSLAVEEHSYLALALIALLTSRKSPSIAMAAAIGLSAAALLNGFRLSLVPQGDGPLYLWRSDVRAASVLMSFAMCIALRPLIERPSRSAAWLTPVGALVAIAFVYRYGMSNLVGLAAGSLAGALAVNMLELAPFAMRRLLSNAVLVWAGTLSFSLYLWQQLFFINWRFEPWGILCIFPAAALALWSFRRVEYPAREYLNRRWTEQPRSEAVETGGRPLFAGRARAA
jgi:peptidoglycan/LPS O-acetylase OafA/YrhL